MDRKFRPGSNERLDVPDALSIHDLADDGLRAAGRVLHTASEPGLTLSGAPVAAIVYGFEVVDNPLDPSQVLITPGVALCEEVVDGNLSGGQISTPRGQRPETLGLPLGTKWIWARFVYTAGDAQNRAFWQPSAVPEFEAIQLHNTRFVAEYQIANTNAAAPPAANAGWFLLATVDFSGGVVAPGLIYDQRTLLFEGQADGLNNPATGWNIPEFDRSDDRSNVGSRSLFGFVMRALRRIIEVSGRKWYDAPAYGENVRSASGAILVSDAAGQTAHFNITATPTVADIEDALTVAFSGADPRNAVRFVSSFVAPPSFAIDTTAAGANLNNVALGSARRVTIDGQATIDRTAGSNAIGITSGAYGWKAVVRGLTFRVSTLVGPALELGSDGDDLIFMGCTFDAPAKVTNLIEIDSAGRYTFIDCDFTGDNTPSTTLVSIRGTAQVRFIGCRFGSSTAGARRGVYVPAGTPSVTVEGCTFDTLSDGVVSLVGSAIRTVDGCTFTGLIGDAVDVAGFFTQATFDGGSQNSGQVVGDSLRANGGVAYMGDGGAFITMSDSADAVLTGFDGVANVPDARFDNFYAVAGRYLFGDTQPAVTGLRFQSDGLDRVALTKDASADATTAILQAAGMHFGTSAVGAARMTKWQIPIAWGRLSYSSGDAPGAVDGFIATKNGITTLDAFNTTLTFLGTDNYHQWTVPAYPGGGFNADDVIVMADLTS
ncbi:MAG: right-handed parallel beta-helix repeat-containing protein, partial [Myxococcales bacterium]|nr:right-handed parallel beta-helix repeat-containing protein [Myxococcales bacterium]